MLFTDIEGSTRLLQELGRESYANALTQHRQLLRAACTAHGGLEVEMQGDSFHFAFASAIDAAAAAQDAQRALEAHSWEHERLRVRIGLHTGEPLIVEGLYTGLDVHRAARIMSAGHGGQVLISQTTRDLLDDSETVLDLGAHRLKDLAAPQRVYQLGRTQFPPLKSLNFTNLPVQPTALVGRQQELEEVMTLLTRVRLLTLVGSGGSGKTRLALEVASAAAADFEHGVWWISLAGVTDGTLVEPTISHAVGAKNGLAEHLGSQEALLLLDNFEQLLDSANVLAGLLESAPRLKLLVTSRAPLRLAAEQEYLVAPMSEDDAVELFVQRARQVKPAFFYDEAVREICFRVDRLPLALELAAARVRTLDAAEILKLLDNRLPLLRGGPRDAPARHRTLAATIDWSHELLDESEKRLFGRLSVFADGCTVDAAEAIADASLGLLEALVEKSLLNAVGGRFTMLETIREFARDQLEQSEGVADLRQRHAAYFLEQAEAARLLDGRPDQAMWLEALESEHQNLRVALEWAAASGQHDVLLRLSTALWVFWHVRGHMSEGRRWLTIALEGAPSQRDDLRARALNGASALASHQGDYGEAKAYSEEAVALSGDGDERTRVLALQGLAIASHLLGDEETAEESIGQALELARHAHADTETAFAIANFGAIALSKGDLKRAADLSRSSARLFRELGAAGGLAVSQYNLGCALLHAGRVDEAAESLTESMLASRDLLDVESIAVCLDAFAAVAVAQTDFERGARLQAAATRLKDQSAIVLQPAEQHLCETTRGCIAAVLDADAYARNAEEGHTMELAEAVEYALRRER